MSNSLRPHRLQHARLPCPSLSPRVCSNSCPLSQWRHPAISSPVVPFSSCLQSFPASVSFPMSQIFTSGGQTKYLNFSFSIHPSNEYSRLISFRIDWVMGVRGKHPAPSPLQQGSLCQLPECPSGIKIPSPTMANSLKPQIWGAAFYFCPTSSPPEVFSLSPDNPCPPWTLPRVSLFVGEPRLRHPGSSNSGQTGDTHASVQTVSENTLSTHSGCEENSLYSQPSGHVKK